MVICHIMRRELQLQSSSSSRTVSTLSPLNRLIYQSATVKMAWERSEERKRDATAASGKVCKYVRDTKFYAALFAYSKCPC